MLGSRDSNFRAYICPRSQIVRQRINCLSFRLPTMEPQNFSCHANKIDDDSAEKVNLRFCVKSKRCPHALQRIVAFRVLLDPQSFPIWVSLSTNQFSATVRPFVVLTTGPLTRNTRTWALKATQSCFLETRTVHVCCSHLTTSSAPRLIFGANDVCKKPSRDRG